MLAAFALYLTLTPPQSRLVRVGVYNNAPLVFVQDGRARGFYIDLLNYIAGEEGWKLDYVLCEWSECLSMLERGEIDLLVDIAYTKDRETRFGFNRETVLSNWGQVYARRGAGIQSLLDLDGRKVAVVRNDVYYESLAVLADRLDLDCQFIEVDGYGGVLALIDAGEADAGMVSRLYGLEHEREYRVGRTPVLCCPVELRFAAPKGRNVELLDVLDRHLSEMKEDPDSAYYQAMNRWFGGLRAGFPPWIKWSLVGASGLVLLFAIGIALMRLQVQARTRELEAEIAERKRTEVALRKSEARYRAVVEEQADLVVRLKPDGTVTFVNQTACRYLGRNCGDLVGHRLAEIAGDEAQEMFLELAGKLKPESPIASTEHRLLLEDGTTGWVQWRFRGIFDGGLVEVQAVGRDITERKLAEERLRQAQADLKARHVSLQMVHMVAEAVYRSLDLREVAQRAVEAMIRYTHSPSVGLFLYREDEECLEPIWIYGGGEAVRKASARLDVRQSQSGRALLKKEVLVSVDLRKDERINPQGRKALMLEGYITLISVPLLAQERAVGVINLAFKKLHRPSAEELETLRAIGQTVGLAVENAAHVAQLEAEIAERKRVEGELQKYAERLETLREIDRAVLEARSSAKTAQAALERIHRLIPYVRGSVIVFDAYEWVGHILAMHAGGRVSCPPGARFVLDEFIGDVGLLERGGTELVELSSRDGLSPLVRLLRREGVNAFLNVPLLVRGEMVGVISLGVARPAEVEPEHVQVAREVADQLAVALQQASLYEQLERYAAELELRVKERTRRLAESEARYRQLVESPLVGIYQADAEGRLVFINRRLAEMGGYEREELVGRATTLDVIIPELRSWLTERMRQWEKGTASSDVVETELVCKDGSRLTVLVAPAGLYDHEGQFAGFIGAVMDITERKQLQEELARQVEEQRRLLNLMAGREIRMAGLKRVIRTLREQLLRAGLEPAADDPIAVSDVGGED